MKFAHFAHVWGKAGMSPAERYRQLWRELALCDELGFDYGFCVEHHFWAHESWMPAPNIYCAVGATHTKRMRLGAMGYIVPLHHPLRLAEEIACTDHMTGGRLEIGLVSGVAPAMFSPFDADFQNRRARTIEFMQMLKVAYTDGVAGFDFKGPFHEFKNVKMSVNPYQRPLPPVWLETRDPDTLAFCAREGLHTGYFMVFSREETAPKYRVFLDQWKKAGQPGVPQIGYSCVVYVDETDEAARKNELHDASQAYRGFFPPTDDPAELKVLQNRQADIFDKAGDHAAARNLRGLLDPEYLLENDLLIIGSPETVTNKLRSLATNGVFNTYLGEFNFGNLPEARLMRSIRLFGEEVMPKLRGFEPF
jgi:alkanesulfonate monooxygenase SsuD/methylene tetrahydromethanopterin reductase-like flavin-dependent oxidoreductase (luciferase family)